jgi:hypothetical protein
MNKELMSGILGKDVADATGEEMLKAFDVLVKRISGDTLTTLQTTTSAKMATLQEKMNLALAAIGKPMLGPFNNLIEKIVGLLDKLESSGILNEIGTQLGRIFEEISKPETWNNIETIVADIAGWFLRMVENTRIMVRGFIGMYFIAKEAFKIFLAVKTKGASLILGGLEATQRTGGLFDIRNLYGENYVNLYTIPAVQVKKVVQMIDFNATNFTLPANQTTTITRDFKFDKNVAIVSLTSHYHERGKLFQIKIKGGPRDGELIYENTDWAHPKVINYETPIQLQAGEGLTSVVTYVNNTNKDLAFGLTSEDEMNIIFGYYYLR